MAHKYLRGQTHNLKLSHIKIVYKFAYIALKNILCIKSDRVIGTPPHMKNPESFVIKQAVISLKAYNLYLLSTWKFG